MKKNKPIQISVAQPCSEDWNKMTPQEQGRFCDSCQKCVVDFSNYSDKELYKYIASHEGQKICGRFKASQLNRNISLPPQPHSQLYKWIVAAGLALIITAVPNSPTFAQAPLTIATELAVDSTKNNETTPSEFMYISGVVCNEYNEILDHAHVKLYRNGILVADTITNDKGWYEVKAKANKYSSFSLLIVHHHCKDAVIDINPNNSNQNIDISLKEPLPEILPTEYVVGLIASPTYHKVDVRPAKSTDPLEYTVPEIRIEKGSSSDWFRGINHDDN